MLTIILDRVTEHMDLGVLMDTKLSFLRHIDTVIARAYSMLGFIMRICSNMDEPYALKSVYVAFVRSRLEYASMVWQPYYNIHSNRIESIQKKFLVFALRNLGWNISYILPPYAARCGLIGLESLERRRINASVFFIYDLLKGVINSPELLSLVNFNTSDRNLRRPLLLRPTLHRTNYGQNEGLNRMIRLFNKIGHLYHVDRNKFRSEVKGLDSAAFSG